MLRNVKDYRRPETIENAVALVQSLPNATYIGGGAWTVAQGDPTLETVVDLQALGLNIITGTLENVQIGATTSLQAIIDHPDTSTIAHGILAEALGYAQSRNLREQGTLGGALITAGAEDPISTALLVMEANVHYADPSIHTAPFTSFVAFRDRLISTKALITGLTIPHPAARSGAAFTVVGRSPKDKPIVCAAAYVTVEEGLVAQLRLAVAGADQRPVRLHKTEHVLRGQLLDENRINTALTPALAELSPPNDYRGSAEYRLAMARVLCRRAMLKAWKLARQRL